MAEPRTNPPTLRGLAGYGEGPNGPNFWGLFATQGDARDWLEKSRKNREFNYYVGWKEGNPAAPWGLQAAWARWVGEGQVHINLWDDNPHNEPVINDTRRTA